MTIKFKNALSKRSVTDYIVVHCSATPEGRDFTAEDIHRMHLDLGWSGIGYHFIIRLDGKVEQGRPTDTIGSHVANYNGMSVGLSYIGGIDKNGQPKDTRTTAQEAAMAALIRELKARYPGAKVQGHRDFPKVAKACPCFDAKSWWATQEAKVIPAPDPNTYVVQKGDTLWGLATKFKTTVGTLVSLNDIHSPDEIYPGAVLRFA